MKTKTMDIYLHRNIDGGWDCLFGTENMADLGFVLIGRGECTFKMIEQAEIVNEQINALANEKELLFANTSIKAAAIDARIQSLLAIAHEGGAA